MLGRLPCARAKPYALMRKRGIAMNRRTPVVLLLGAVTLSTVGCSEIQNATGTYSCDSVADEVLKIETPTGQDKLIGIVERKGPQTDKSTDPPENGIIYSCNGQGVFNSGLETPIKYWVEARDGQLFVYYEAV